ncbi:gliding motility lipoprotein GldH [Flammeovirga pectinis]|uniref:Gliding motility lipoprotein GldH n=1 Tax=Flammeovirga pectinis TaxID=2494373 RepID=A0A3S9NYL1_9BACT|nr:gliding motility lipoprotein GldH [Flammeovirga pectinis]AZQ61019.1 gliding motility lipoprotein GldH [Flammeovirga pectinis]
MNNFLSLKSYKALLLLGVAFLSFACNSSIINEEYVDYEEGVWPADSVSSFTFEVEDAKPYNIYALIRNTTEYPFQNIYIKYSLTKVDSLQPDTLINDKMSDFQLFEVKTGEPFGHIENSTGFSSTGAVFVHPLLLRKKTSFPSKGTYKIDIKHYMRPDTLEGVIGVGYRLEHVE